MRIPLLFGLSLCSLSLSAAPLDKVTMQLDWKPNAQFAGLLAAKENGFYKDAGLDVTILSVDGTMDTVGRVVKGGAWIGCAESHVLLASRAQGKPIKAFATMMQASPFALITLKKSKIKTVTQLKGRTIGLHADGDKAIDVVLGTNGLKRSDVIIKKMPYNFDLLLNGQVDAMQGYLVDEVVALEEQGIPIQVIPMSEHGYTAYGQVYFTNEKFLKSKPDVVKRFLQASNAGWQYAARNPRKTAQMIITKYQPGASLAYQEGSLRHIIPVLTAENSHMGMMRESTWEEAARMFSTYRILDRYVSPSELVTYDVLKACY